MSMKLISILLPLIVMAIIFNKYRSINRHVAAIRWGYYAAFLIIIVYLLSYMILFIINDNISQAIIMLVMAIFVLGPFLVFAIWTIKNTFGKAEKHDKQLISIAMKDNDEISKLSNSELCDLYIALENTQKARRDVNIMPFVFSEMKRRNIINNDADLSKQKVFDEKHYISSTYTGVNISNRIIYIRRNETSKAIIVDQIKEIRAREEKAMGMKIYSIEISYCENTNELLAEIGFMTEKGTYQNVKESLHRLCNMEIVNIDKIQHKR